MKSLSGALRALFAIVAVSAGLALAAPVAAQVVNPTAEAVSEEALLNALQAREAIGGRVSIPDQAAANLIKPAGPDWRARHQGTMFWLTIGASLSVLTLLVIYYLVRGPMRVESGWSGVRIVRFNGVERFAHWLTATSFIVLALSGLNLVIGRYVLLPLIGPDSFALVTQMGKLGHNYLAWPFMLGVVLMFLVWVRDNLPQKGDGVWLAAAGGMLGGDHPPAHRFNAGQKIIFWVVILGGAALSATGVLLLFPALGGDYANWQLSQVLHGAIGAVMVAIILAHIYLGSIGMEGAFEAMAEGEVDLSWAREHHAYWAQELAEKGRVAPTGAQATPAE